jgi:hypothetical protein
MTKVPNKSGKLDLNVEVYNPTEHFYNLGKIIVTVTGSKNNKNHYIADYAIRIPPFAAGGNDFGEISDDDNQKVTLTTCEITSHN